jgi:hypothetical protein
MNAGQILMIWWGLWIVCLIWPRMGYHLSVLLARHSVGMKTFYTFLRMGIREYFSALAGDNVSWEGHPDFVSTTNYLTRVK